MTSSKDYWAAREKAQQEANKKLDAKFDKELKKIYDAALANVQQEIDAFYGRYAGKEGISLAEAKKRVSQLDIKAYEAKAKEYVANRTFTKQANEEMRLYNLTMKVNRLEMLKSRIGMELAAQCSKMERKAAEHLQGGAESEFKRMAGILGKSVPNAKKAASTIPGASFHNATYSERIWMNQRALKGEIDKLLQEGMIQGRNPRTLAPQLQRAFDVSRVASERLMRTEMCRVQIEAQRQSYDENGIDEYEYMAHAGCCEICAAMNGKVFKVRDMVVGDNAPPLHPRCRCGTVPHMDMEAYDRWLDSGAAKNGVDFNDFEQPKEREESHRKSKYRRTEIARKVIESPDYGRKFSNLDESKNVKGKLKEAAVEMLKHRSGTKYEDMVFVDSVGGTVRKQSNYTKAEMQVEPTKAMKKMVQEASEYTIISMHNHAENSMPSTQDIETAYNRKYKYGIIACHDGSVYKYKIGGRPNLYVYYSALVKLDKEGYTKKRIGSFIQEVRKANIQIEVL